MSLLANLSKKKLLRWAVEFSLALCLIYSLLYLAGYFGLSFFVLSNRGMVEHGVSGSLVSASLDPFVWGGGVFVVLAGLFYGLGSGRVGGIYRFLTGFVLFGLVGLIFLIIFGLVSVFALVLVSVLVAVLCFVYSFGFFGVSRFGLFKGLLLGGFLIVLFVELAALVLFNVPAALNLSPQLSGAALHWNSVELSFSNLGYPFLPYVYLLFVLLGVVAFVVRVLPLDRLVTKFRSGWFDKFVDRLGSLFELRDGGFGFLGGRFVVLAVVVSAVVSCLFVVFTVLPWANPTSMLVSADAPVYYQWIVHMRSVDVNSALSFALGNDRALFLVLSYVLSFFVSPLNVVQFAGALLIVLFGVVSLLVLRLVVSFRAVWVFGVLLVPFSFQSLGLIYSGYFANMLALILVFVYVLLFFKVLDHFSSLGFFALLGVSGLVFFSHSWTWFIFALALCMFLFLQWRLASNDRRFWGRFKIQVVYIGATVVVGLLSDLVRRLLSSGSPSSSVLATAQSSLSFPNAAYLLSGLRESIDFVLGGVFANQLLVFLSVVGFLVLVRFRSEVSNFLVAWVLVGCVSILFAARDFVFDRFLFLMPWVVLSSLGLFFVIGFVSSRVGGWKGWRLWVLILVLLLIFLVLINGSLRFIFNINIF